MRILKLLGVAICILVLLIAGGVYDGLKIFKSYAAHDLIVESITEDSQELSAHIERIVSFGVRNPGTAGDLKTREYIL